MALRKIRTTEDILRNIDESYLSWRMNPEKNGTARNFEYACKHANVTIKVMALEYVQGVRRNVVNNTVQIFQDEVKEIGKSNPRDEILGVPEKKRRTAY